jgi:hypothetical protein
MPSLHITYIHHKRAQLIAAAGPPQMDGTSNFHERLIAWQKWYLPVAVPVSKVIALYVAHVIVVMRVLESGT